jgi:divinyl protochlorophyllide a 8-vinyl-reductase
MMQQLVGKIGPNAIIQTVQAMKEIIGVHRAEELLVRAGRDDLLIRLPDEMIDEAEFQMLAHALFEQLGESQALRILRRSGQLTARYLLRHRIPQPAQRMLRLAPQPIALWLLLSAINKHAWTFVGSGEFRYTLGRSPMITITRCIACAGIRSETPICSFYTGCFEHLFRTLIDPRAQVFETECESCGDLCCRFAIWV